MQNSSFSKTDFRNIIDIYLSKWKYITVFLIIILFGAFLNLRYATYEYETSASIKIQEDQKSNQLSEISAFQSYGLFSSNFNKIEDEVKILKSRAIIRKVITDLKLNLSLYVEGKIKDEEVYTNPPININFFESDSVINETDTTLFVKIISKNKFELSGYDINELIELNEDEGVSEHAFGDKIRTGFGDIIITPNFVTTNNQNEKVIQIQLTPVEKLIEIYSEKIKVSTSLESNIINLSIQDGSPDKAELILNTIISKYNDDVVNDKEEVIAITSNFISNRLKVVAQELEQVDLTAENLKKNNRLSDLGAQSSIFLQSEKENEAKLVATTNQIQLIEYMSDYLVKNNESTDLLPANIGISDGGVEQLTKSHNNLVLQRNRILKSSSDKNPTIINLNNQILALKNNLKLSLNNFKSSSEITLRSLNKEDVRINSQIFAAPKKERQFRDITRQQGIKESLYLYLLKKREETAITLGMSSPNAKIVEKAYTSNDPVNPRKTIVYLAALFFGFSIPILVIYIIDILDTKIHTKKDLEKTINAPFIGDIPKSDTKKKNRLISKVDYSPKAEAFRILRTNISYALRNKKDKLANTIFVTSTTSQEGKSHTSTNLASSLSYSNLKVLLIETDIRVPKIAEYLNLKNSDGITDFIINEKLVVNEIVTNVPNNNYLDVICAGTIPPNPSELLMSDRVQCLFDNVKKSYDYIIVDTAAVGLVTDTLLISHFADMFIYVVSANNIDKRQLNVAQDMYNDNRLPNMSLLLNGTKKKSGYGYGYGSNPKEKKWYKFS